MIKRKYIWIFTLSVLIFSCAGSGSDSDQKSEKTKETKELSQDEAEFLKNLSSLCGKSFRGKETYVEPGRESWSDKKMIMHVRVCEEDQVHIPFHIDEDTSRTWMFMNEEGKLRFRHDHRHADGTPEAQTLYGGYADGAGSAYQQFFPSDQYTIDLLTDTLNRQWNVVLSENMDNFSYQLQYHGKVIFRVDFDLTDPL